MQPEEVTGVAGAVEQDQELGAETEEPQEVAGAAEQQRASLCGRTATCGKTPTT